MMDFAVPRVIDPSLAAIEGAAVSDVEAVRDTLDEGVSRIAAAVADLS